MKEQFTRAALLAGMFLAGALIMGMAQRVYSQNAASNPQANSPAGATRRPLGKQLWVIIARPVDSRPNDPDLGRRHIAHQDELERQGIMFGAGPVADAQGNPEYGMIIVRASSAAEAKRIADSDPMHSEGRRTYTLHRWTLNEGRMNITVNFSDGTYAFQ